MNKKQYVKPELTEVILDSQISIQTASTDTGSGTGGGGTDLGDDDDFGGGNLDE